MIDLELEQNYENYLKKEKSLKDDIYKIDLIEQQIQNCSPTNIEQQQQLEKQRNVLFLEIKKKRNDLYFNSLLFCEHIVVDIGINLENGERVKMCLKCNLTNAYFDINQTSSKGNLPVRCMNYFYEKYAKKNFDADLISNDKYSFGYYTDLYQIIIKNNPNLSKEAIVSTIKDLIKKDEKLTRQLKNN